MIENKFSTKYDNIEEQFWIKFIEWSVNNIKSEESIVYKTFYTVTNEFKEYGCMIWQDIRALNSYYNMYRSHIIQLKSVIIEKEITLDLWNV